MRVGTLTCGAASSYFHLALPQSIGSVVAARSIREIVSGGNTENPNDARQGGRTAEPITGGQSLLLADESPSLDARHLFSRLVSASPTTS